MRAFQIRFESHCSPFKDAIVHNGLLAIGHQGHFYLYDLLENISLFVLHMDGYFEHLYFKNNLFYVTSSGSIYCISEKGNLVWENYSLGIDGILINRFSEDKIYGSGEWDPPGGWQGFVLDITTGNLIK